MHLCFFYSKSLSFKCRGNRIIEQDWTPAMPFSCLRKFYQVFTKVLPSFYEVFTKFLRRFFTQGFFKHSKIFARGFPSTLIFFDVKYFSTSKICRLVFQALYFLTSKIRGFKIRNTVDGRELQVQRIKQTRTFSKIKLRVRNFRVDLNDRISLE